MKARAKWLHYSIVIHALSKECEDVGVDRIGLGDDLAKSRT